MKKLFVSLVAVVAATLSYAQSSMLATLSHEGEISTFYGSNALKEAHAAAVHGDVITLSSGSFASIDITKAVTIRGAGMEVDARGVLPTIITGDFGINISNQGENKLTMEGIYHNNTISVYNVSGPMFLKCRFKDISTRDIYGNTLIMSNASFIHCKIAERLDLSTSESSASFINCVAALSGYNCNIQNCIIMAKKGTYSEIGIRNSSISNSILYYDPSTSLYVDGSTSAFNNIAFTEGTFKTSPNATNVVVPNLSDVFKDFTGIYNDNISFELTEEAKTTYLGIDGTQVGIYGGTLPFDPTPTNPQITKCNVAAKSTADGKLSVDIEVNGAQ